MRFSWEWIGIATLPITIPLLLATLFRGEFQRAMLEGPLPIVALCGYAIAVSFAFLHDVPTTNYMKDERKVLKLVGSVYYILPNAIVILSALLIVVGTLSEKVPVIHDNLSAWVVFWCSLSLALSGAVLALLVVVFRLDLEGVMSS